MAGKQQRKIVKLTKERETKGAVLFKADEDQERVADCIYIRKEVFKNRIPSRLVLWIDYED